MRLRKKKSTPGRLEMMKDYFVDTNQLLDVNGLFPNNQNDYLLHIEIGAGKGKFITACAAQNPDINYIAFEKNADIISMAAIKAAGLPNVRFANTDAEVIHTLFKENSVDRIYLNFSDPWKKSKQKKRRLTHRNFLEKYQTILKPGGEIHFKTDNRPLFEFSLLEMAEFNMTLSEVYFDLHNQNPQNNIMTEYEEKFSALGAPIHKVIAKFKK
ncbi:MAG: tRNA (guanosine(46)-N7)-methyltransferase TrmB [Clostridiales bacterium 43-6]|nr:MAG: tRNA (guanosine(46)-N7)-methyltransferase TrmB [Clostridiales bacterium 43-6]